MTTPVWAPGTLYAPGAIVLPVSALPPVPDPVLNGGFESGATGWTLDAGMSILQPGPGAVFQGTWSLTFDANGIKRAVNQNQAAVVPGQVVHGSLQAIQNFAGGVTARASIAWYTAADAFISYSEGADISIPPGGGWRQSDVTGTAPAGAAFARFVVRCNRTSGAHVMWIDNCVWDLLNNTATTGLVFKAIQAIAGYSGVTEPTWPVIVGNTVVDNGVTWQAAVTSRVTWTASPILTSSAAEPAWPIISNGTVLDNNIIWVAMDARVADTNCPNSKVVAIAAGKIFSPDRDIISFSATVNPLDWTTAQDAGFLPFGLQTYGSTPCTALGLYRSNLVAFNSEGYQMWQVDEDPANMALLDASPVDCPYPKSVESVSNDLVFLSSQGIRNIGIAGASTNLQAGFFGKQIDPLVKAAILACDDSRALFWPGAGQYWLFFGAQAFVLTMNGGAKDSSWSRYVFPDAIDNWSIQGTDLFIRAGNVVWRVSSDALEDDMDEVVIIATEENCAILTEAGDFFIAETPLAGASTVPVPFTGYIVWPYLDFGMLGVDKEMSDFDLVCTGNVDVSFGYNQNNAALATTPYTVAGDTLPGTPIPMPISGPSFQMRLTFAANQAWEWSAAAIRLSDQVTPS